MYLDTHVAVWLYEKDEERISRLARELIESSELLVSPMVLLEVEFLFETGIGECYEEAGIGDTHHDDENPFLVERSWASRTDPARRM